MQEVDSPPGTVMDTSSPAENVGSGNASTPPSPTPSQKAREWEKKINQSMGDYPSKPTDELVQCANCSRSFAKERLQTHISICKNTKDRKIYDIAQARIIGTEAEQLYKSGKLQLDKPKPMEKKSVLTAKVSSATLIKNVLPPIKANSDRKISTAKVGNNAATAYQVTFGEDDKIKTKKNKFNAPLSMNAPTRKQDERFLSTNPEAQKRRWRSAAMRISPALSAKMKKGKKHTASGDMGDNYPLGPHNFDIDEDEDGEDFLAASWASSKTVCSDAFDFLFDEKNMNPETVIAKQKEQDALEIKPDANFGKDGTISDAKDSKCCVIC